MEDMSRVQEKAKHERQNDDYATANTHQNSSSLNDNAHHIRRRLSQTITSRHCLLIAIALASLSAHACDDTVELQVTCDSGNTPWVVPSHITQTDNTIETNPQLSPLGRASKVVLLISLKSKAVISIPMMALSFVLKQMFVII